MLLTPLPHHLLTPLCSPLQGDMGPQGFPGMPGEPGLKGEKVSAGISVGGWHTLLPPLPLADGWATLANRTLSFVPG